MSEKEFLDKYLNHLIDSCYLEVTDITEDIEDETIKFLSQFHQEYYEVEFVEKTEENIKQDKELNIFMETFNK